MKQIQEPHLHKQQQHNRIRSSSDAVTSSSSSGVTRTTSSKVDLCLKPRVMSRRSGSSTRRTHTESTSRGSKLQSGQHITKQRKQSIHGLEGFGLIDKFCITVLLLWCMHLCPLPLASASPPFTPILYTYASASPHFISRPYTGSLDPSLRPCCPNRLQESLRIP